MAKGLGHLSKIGLEMDMVYEKCLVFQRDFLDFLKKKIKADTYLVAAGADAACMDAGRHSLTFSIHHRDT